MKRIFEFNDEKSSKFWSIELNGNEFTVIFGKTGTNGQSQTKQFSDETACQKEAEKLIREKTKKGYVEQGGIISATNNSAEKEGKTTKEQKYVPKNVTDFDNIMSPIRWEDDEKTEDVESFIDYYEENCGKPYAIVTDKNISLIWENPEDTEEKHICTITPSTQTIEFKPLDGKKVKVKISDETMSMIEAEAKLWKLEITPFKAKKEKAKKLKPLEMVTINGNPNADQIPMPNNLLIRCVDKSRGVGWDITANYHKKKHVYANNDYKKQFATVEESIVDLIKVALSVNRTPGFEVAYLCDGHDEEIKYSIDDMEQLVFQYTQAQSPSDSTVLELPIYDPEDDARTYMEAIKQGNVEMVRQILLAGADFNIKDFNTAVKFKQREVALVFLEHYKVLGEEVYDWMIEDVESI